MKKFLFAALAAVVTLASCSKDNDGAQSVGSDAKLTITVTAPGTRSASTTAPVASDDTTIAGFTAFFVDSDNSVTQATALPGSDELEATVKTSIKKVYVIANADEDFSSVATLSDLTDYLADLNVSTEGSQLTTRWATGEVDIISTDFVLQADNSLKAEKSISLYFIAARITLKIATSGDMATYYDATPGDGSLVLQNVAVLNASGASKLFGTSLIPASLTSFAGSEFYSGIDDPASPDNFTYFPAAADYAQVSYLIDAIPADDVFDEYYYYYVFENDAKAASEFPTIITIIGEYKGEKTYFPVHLAPYEISGLTQSIERGKSYDITITLTGDPREDEGGGGGGEDPTEPSVNGLIKLDIKIEDWVPVTFNKTF